MQLTQRTSRSRGRNLSRLRIEAVCKPAAVDVEGFEDLEDRIQGNSPGVRPADDVEVFLSCFESIEDAVEE